MHVHLTPVELAEGTVSWADDFASGSRAAAAGGITTIGNISFPRPGERLGALLERVTAEAEQESIVDFVLHPVLLDPDTEAIAEIPELARRGQPSLKIFMILGDFDARAGDYLEAMATAGESGMLTLVHCEDQCIISHLTRRLIEAGRGDLSNYPASRPVAAEWAAVSRAIGYAEATGAPIYIVHLSSLEALDVARRARARGVPVFVETRPIYLYFTSERFDDARGPALRRQPAAARARRPRRALVRARGRCGADLLHRPRCLDARGETRPFARRSPTPRRGWPTSRR